jgi:integrase
MASTNGRATGHVKLREGARGPVWYGRVRLPDGRQQQRRIGHAWLRRGRPPGDAYFTRAMAEAKLREILDAADRGELAGQRASGATFADAAGEYLRYVEKVRKIDQDTVDDYAGVLNGYLLDDDRLRELGVKPFSDRPLESLDADDIDRYKEALIAEGRLSNRTIVRHLTVLHGLFKRAGRAYGLERNPASADLVERPRVTYSGEYSAYEPDEVELLAAHAENPQDGAIVRVAAYTGLRQGELLGLRWRDVDFVTGLLHVQRAYVSRRTKTPKGKRVRPVPMMPQVVDALVRLKEREHFTGDDDLVFCSTLGGHLDAWALRRRWYRTIKRAGLPRLRFHDLRHTFGTHAVRELDGYAVQSYMGHAHYSTTQRYLHHKPRPRDAEALERAFGGARDDPRAVAPADPQPAADRNGLSLR